MKNSTTFRLAALALFASSLGHISAAPYEPEGRLIRWTQQAPAPNNVTLTLRAFGDEYHSRVETLTGYTVVYSAPARSYFYARLSSDATQFELTSPPVLANFPPPVGLTRKIDLPADAIFRKTTAQRNIYETGVPADGNGQRARWDRLVAAGPNAGRTQGVVVGLTILVEFSDAAFPGSTRDKVVRLSNFGFPGETLSNGVILPPVSPTPAFVPPSSDGNAGSVYNYFSDQSSGKLRYVQIVSPVIRLSGTRASYDDVSKDARANGTKLLEDAIAALRDPTVSFDTSAFLDPAGNDNGRLRSVNIIVAGADSGLPMQGLWPHTTRTTDEERNSTEIEFLPETSDTSDPNAIRTRRFITEYSLITSPTSLNGSILGTTIPPVSVATLTNTTSLTANNQFTVGSLCRESAKMLFGCPDLSTAGNVGVGNYCLMGTGAVGGVGTQAIPANRLTFNPTPTVIPATPPSSASSGRRPAPLNPYFKNVLGWNSVTDVSPEAVETRVLPTAGNVAVRIRRPASTTESFIFENRGAPDRWIGTLDAGLAVWQIDAAQNGNVFTDTSSRNGVSIEQADGLFNLETNTNNGDANDMFDTAKPQFSDSTVPNANWLGGEISFARARILSSALGPNIDVLFGLPANTIEVLSPRLNQEVFSSDVLKIIWKANITGRVRIELFKGGVFNSVIAASEDNDRLFNWTIPRNLPFGNEYTIKITSISNPVAASAFSQSFRIDDGVFPPNGQIPHGWVNAGSKKFRWKVTRSRAFEGKFSLAAENVGDGRTAGIAYSSNFRAGIVGFWMRVSSEKRADVARFFIDNVAQTLSEVPNPTLPTSERNVTDVSGESNWKFYSFPVTEGNHTFKWIYRKDDSYKSGNDAVWLDLVTFPQTTQEIAIQDPANNFISSGVDTTQVPEANDGGSSATQTFRILNTGNADLLGLQVSVEGANSGDFTIRPPSSEVVLPGGFTTFAVSFTPKGVGFRSATLRVRSNDVDESNFLIQVEGNALPYPRIGLSQATKQLVDNDKNRLNYGKTQVRNGGKSKSFTITNNGSAPLTDLAISKSGKFRRVYELGSLSATSLAPGESTIITVSFKPKKIRGNQKASISISSNDGQTGRFDVKLNGEGIAKKKKKSKEALVLKSSLASSSSLESAFGSFDNFSATDYSTAVDVVDGHKYLSLTVAKSAENAGSLIEVSSDLIDWYSGDQYTTTILDNATTLKVRDNTPVTPEAKRYIRLK